MPTSEDAARTGFAVNDLAAGRDLYVRKCSSCHTLFAPETRPHEAWVQAVDEMRDRVRLTADEREMIVRYLTTMSDRPVSSAAP